MAISDIDVTTVASDPETWPVLADAADRGGVLERTLRNWVARNHVIAARSARGRIHVYWPSLADRLYGPGQLITDGTGSPSR